MDANEHPLLHLVNDLGVTRNELADQLDIPRVVFRQLVRGHTAASWRRAREWETATDGQISAESVMRWQDELPREAGRRK